MHGVIMVFFFLIPSIPAMLGNFLVPLMIGARDLAFPAAQPAELVHLHARRRCSRSYAVICRRRRHRLDVLHALQHAPTRTPTSSPTALGIFITGFSSILTGLNFIVTIHKMRAPGHDLVPPAAVRLGASTPPASSSCWHAGAGHHAGPAGARAAASTSASSTRRSAAIRCCSSICSGSTRTRPSTS